MTAARALLFNLFFWSWTALVSILGLPTLLLSHRVVEGVAKFWARGVIGGLGVLCGLRHEIRGLERLPQGSYILAAKHQSAWDTVIFPLIIENYSFVLKKELLSIPFFGWYLARQDSIAVDRKGTAKALRQMLHRARAALVHGRCLIIFPEGTRVAPGARRPYLPGVAALYKELRVPVVPVALNSGLFWGRRAFLKRPGTIVMQILPPIPPGLDRREFMTRLEGVIETESDRLAGLATGEAAEVEEPAAPQ